MGVLGSLWLLAAACLPWCTALTATERAELAAEVKEMFYHTYNSYMDFAYPADELMPLSCKGRVRGIDKDRGDTDHAMGGFSLTLIDTLDTLAVLGDFEEFMNAVHLVTQKSRFNNDLVVSVFEVTIRALGGLLSAHVIAEEVQRKGLNTKLPPYTGGLLDRAVELGERLIAAYDTPTGIPYLRINLAKGHIPEEDMNTCVACAGSSILEFAALSRLSGRPEFEEKARRAMEIVFSKRNKDSDLIGRLINTQTGNVSNDGGIGAGIDSYYEYLYKAYVMLDDPLYLNMFVQHYSGIMKHLKRGPFYVDGYINDPVLVGDLPSAVEMHQALLRLSRLHGGLVPETYGKDMSGRDLHYYLRPEFIESTYMLYHATKSPIYLKAGREVVRAIQKKAHVQCGYTALSNLHDGTKEDRLDSFFLAETIKYLYLLFEDPQNIRLNMDDYVFTTEAHLLPISLSQKPTNKKRTPFDSTLQKLGGSTWNADTCPNHRTSRWLFVQDALLDMYIPPALDICMPMPELERRRKAVSEGYLDWSDTATLKFFETVGIWVTFAADQRVNVMFVPDLAVDEEAKKLGHSLMEEFMQRNKEKKEPKVVDPKKRTLDILSVEGAKARFEAWGADFGPDLFATGVVQGFLVEADPQDACMQLSDNEKRMAGMIVLVVRGTCSFIQKVRNVQHAGAAAAIIFDDRVSDLVTMVGDGREQEDPIHIPSVFITKSHGAAVMKILAHAVSQGSSVPVALSVSGVKLSLPKNKVVVEQ